MKVLYLSEWYPSRRDKMAGLFVQKHAQAVAAQGCEVRVNTFWAQADIVQLNVLTLKKGLIAYVLKRVFGIPYIIVEHWSGYLPENGAFERFAGWKKKLLRMIAIEASGIYPVSDVLAENMKRCGIENARWGKINNVVDDFFYQSVVRIHQSEITNLLHVSCFDERAKNVCGLLRAIKQISEKRQDFCLTLVGTGKDWQMCRDYAKELAIPELLLQWTGEVPPEKVCEYMQRSDVFVASSRYENAPVVLSECIAVGLPVIATEVGGISEMIHKKMGLLVTSEDDDALAQAIEYMLDHYQEYDKASIRSYGKQYAMDEVGKRLISIYQAAIGKKCE